MQRDSQSSANNFIAQKENNYQRMNTQKSQGQIISMRPSSASKQGETGSNRPVMQYSDHITALMKQSNAFGAASGQYMNSNGGEKTRNN